MKRSFKIKNLKVLSRALKSQRLGDLLVKSGSITQDQLSKALERQDFNGKKLGHILLRQKSISATELYSRLVQQYFYKACAIALSFIVLMATPNISQAGNLGQEFRIAREVQNTLNYPKLFGTNEIKSQDISPFTKWTSAIERYDDQLKTVSKNTNKVMQWKNMVYQSKQLSNKEKIQTVNKFINKYKYIEDKDNYNMLDYWATPIEFLTRGGDCEDFAIAKYVSLRALGFSENQLRIAIVTDTVKNIPHAVLIVYVDGESLVLDNQNKQVRNTLAVNRYKTIFSINSGSWWMHTSAKTT